MPLVFIHGVNTRSTDEDYVSAAAARKAMFQELVVPAMAQKGFPDFAVADDIYWGDLGVAFAWHLRSIPDTAVLQSLGPETEAAVNLDLLDVIGRSDLQTPDEVERLGPEPALVTAARTNPGGLVRAVFAPEADRFAPPDLIPPAVALSEPATKRAENRGAHLGFILIAADQLAHDAEQDPSLIAGTTDNQVLQKIQDGVFSRYRALVEPKLQANDTQTQKLGVVGDAIGWATDHIKAVIGAAKQATSSAVAVAQRGASLLALKAGRDGISRKALRFLGDVFVYLHHGRPSDGSISARVRDGLLATQSRQNAEGRPEPMIVVTHSFGSEILYDLLMSGAIASRPIDLWVTAGAQTSLFAEMSLFSSMPSPLPDTATFALGRPQGVSKWINFYDPADVLSYKHEPVFGAGAVTDIPVRAGGNLANAHGHYFVDPEFYRRIASEVV